MEKFAIGLIVGGVCGAVLTANNFKMRTLVRKAQEEFQMKLDNLMDEKICAMENGAATPQEYPETDENENKRDKKSKRK